MTKEYQRPVCCAFKLIPVSIRFLNAGIDISPESMELKGWSCSILPYQPVAERLMSAHAVESDPQT